jgi:hypothetical protein
MQRSDLEHILSAFLKTLHFMFPKHGDSQKIITDGSKLQRSSRISREERIKNLTISTTNWTGGNNYKRN